MFAHLKMNAGLAQDWRRPRRASGRVAHRELGAHNEPFGLIASTAPIDLRNLPFLVSVQQNAASRLEKLLATLGGSSQCNATRAKSPRAPTVPTKGSSVA
jgi:hypothetical protein